MGLERTAVEAVPAAAARAPSAHNTQPRRGRGAQDRIVVEADPSRWLRHGDPARRDLDLSVGAFIEALRLALAAAGVRAECADPLAFRSGGGTELALHPGAKVGAEERGAASLLRRRQTSRLRYSPRPPEPAALEALARSAAAAGLALHLVERAAPERRDLDAWFYAASRESWLDPRAVTELAGWVRFDPEGARRPDDGISTHCLGLSPAETAAMVALT